MKTSMFTIGAIIVAALTVISVVVCLVISIFAVSILGLPIVWWITLLIILLMLSVGGAIFICLLGLGDARERINNLETLLIEKKILSEKEIGNEVESRDFEDLDKSLKKQAIKLCDNCGYQIFPDENKCSNCGEIVKSTKLKSDEK